jgi:hypothetical protein
MHGAMPIVNICCKGFGLLLLAFSEGVTAATELIKIGYGRL